MKKVCYFFSSFLPIIMAFCAQFLALALMLGVAALFLYPAIPSARGSDTDIYSLFDLLLDMNFNSCVMILYTIICIVLLGLWYYYSCGGDFLPQPSRTFNTLEFIAIVVLVPGMQFFTTFLMGIISEIFPKWMEQYEKLMETAGLTSDISPIMLVYAVILGPICEELIFRGVTMRQARKALPFWLANLLQAFLFGLFHGNWIQGIYAFTLGLVFGFICERGGSIYYTILFHILFNLWGTVISEQLSGIEETPLTALVMFVIMIVSLVLGTLLFIFGMKKKEAKLHSISSPPITQSPMSFTNG